MNKPYKRKISAWERMLNWSPYSIVAMVTRIKGNVSEQMVKNAVDKVQQRHTLLRVRIELDEEQTPWFTSEGVQEIPIEVIPRTNDDSWIEVYDKACKEPFEFDKRPAIRFYLLQSENTSDIVIFCHHVICDGMSLAYLARDLMVYLGDQDHEVEILPDPLPISREIIPEDQKLASIVMKVMDKINNKWEQEKVLFDQEDYLNLHEIYWKNFTHKTISIELSEEQTNQLVNNCKREKVSVNSALVTAFVGAQNIVQGKKPFHSKIGVGGDLRNRLTPPDQKDRLAWKGGFRERQLIEEGGIEPDDSILAEINKRLIIKCDNGLELIK